MEIKLPNDLADAIIAVATATGLPAEQLACDALRAHFPCPPQALQEEFDAWERASDEDAAKIQPDQER